MNSVMMLSITIEFSVNIKLPLKGRPQAWLGHSWALLDTLLGILGTFGKPLLLGKLCLFGLWAKFTKSKK